MWPGGPVQHNNPMPEMTLSPHSVRDYEFGSNIIYSRWRELVQATPGLKTEAVFLNFYGAQKSIPRELYSYMVPCPHRLFKNSSTGGVTLRLYIQRGT
jgi:hypothetical protein